MKDIERVACVGGGTIGSSWAALFSANVRKVYLYDLEEEILDSALDNIDAQLSSLSKKGLVKKSINDLIGKIKTTTDMAEALNDVDYVQESAPESYKVKKEVFREMDNLTSRETILASSTSGLLMTKIQRATENPKRCVIAHPWNPPLLVPLVEIVPGENTSPKTVNKTIRIMKNLGKSPVRLKKEVPGFIGNRLQAAVWREACSLVDRGVANLEEVDKALSKGPGIRWAFMGPHLTFHLGGGEGGIKHFIDHLVNSFSEWWRDMDDWDKMPYTTAKEVIRGMQDYEIIQKKSFEELVDWRDEKLVKLLKELYGEENQYLF